LKTRVEKLLKIKKGILKGRPIIAEFIFNPLCEIVRKAIFSSNVLKDIPNNNSCHVELACPAARRIETWGRLPFDLAQGDYSCTVFIT